MSEQIIARRILTLVHYVRARQPFQQPMFMTLGPKEMVEFDRLATEICTFPDVRCLDRTFMGMPVKAQAHPGITLHTCNLYAP